MSTGAGDFVPPTLVFQDTEWTSRQIARLAWWWHRRVLERGVAERSPLLALVMANHPESVALFFGLSALPADLIVLPADPRGWHSSPPVPPGTAVVLTPGQAPLASTAARLRLNPIVLDAPADPADSWPPAPLPLRARGTILFTSGSTGAARPVYRSFAGFMLAVEASIEAYGFRPGDGIIGTLPLSSSHGLVQVLILGSRLRSRVALLERFDHRATISLFHSGAYGYWPAIPLMADAVGRAPLSEAPPRGPRICTVTGGGLSATVFAAFRQRFGVPLRSAYGATEAGLLAVPQDVGDCEPECVGTAMPSVSLLVADDPEHPAPTGQPGRIWVRSPWYTEGYGFPPALELPEQRDGWFATRDIGAIDGRGRLVLLGRLDDCFKTANGHLVSPAHVAGVACGCPGVHEALAVAVPGGVGMVIGLVVSGSDVTGEAVRRHAAQFLPEWSWPRHVRVLAELPRLPGGKIDREACAALFAATRSPGEALAR